MNPLPRTSSDSSLSAQSSESRAENQPRGRGLQRQAGSIHLAAAQLASQSSVRTAVSQRPAEDSAEASSREISIPAMPARSAFRNMHRVAAQQAIQGDPLINSYLNAFERAVPALARSHGEAARLLPGEIPAQRASSAQAPLLAAAQQVKTDRLSGEAASQTWCADVQTAMQKASGLLPQIRSDLQEALASLPSTASAVMPLTIMVSQLDQAELNTRFVGLNLAASSGPEADLQASEMAQLVLSEVSSVPNELLANLPKLASSRLNKPALLQSLNDKLERIEDAIYELRSLLAVKSLTG